MAVFSHFCTFDVRHSPVEDRTTSAITTSGFAKTGSSFLNLAWVASWPVLGIGIDQQRLDVEFDATTTAIFLLPVSSWVRDSDHAKCGGVFFPTPSSVLLPGARTYIGTISADIPIVHFS